MVRWVIIFFQLLKFVQIGLWKSDKMSKIFVLNLIFINLTTLMLPIVYQIYLLEVMKYNLLKYNKTNEYSLTST